MNPYFAYSFSFFMAVAVYLLGWSEAYPPLTKSLLGFLLLTIAFHFTAGIFWRKASTRFPVRLNDDFNIIRITLFIWILWIADFTYEGGIPLFKILWNEPYNYRLFGIPTLHVFIVTFSSFYTIYIFHLFLSTKRKFVLVIYILHLFAAILIYSRAMFMFNLCASGFLFLWYKPKYVRYILLIIPIVILLLYLFGAAGNMRVSREANSKYDSELFLQKGQATNNFKESFIPNEFFWFYIYTSSPLANLQQNINNADRHVSWSWFFKMVNNEMIFNFISKRINSIFGIPHPGEYTIEGPFNVSTVYSRSFSHLSWTGMFVMAIFILVIPFIYRMFLSPAYLGSGLALLSTMFLFMAYDNTISFTGLSFQLCYPLLFGWLEKKEIFSLRKATSYSS